jgi:hypothetical protein
VANGPGGPAAGGEPQPSAEAILAECRRQRRRALGWAAISGVLLVALVVATLVAAARDAYHGVAVVLIPLLIVLNLLRLAQCGAALGKIRRAERLVHEAQERYRVGDTGAR